MADHRMRAWCLDAFGFENLRTATLTTPVPGPGDLLVRVNAVSLNYRDRLVVMGQLLPRLPAMPFIPVSDFAGDIVAVGDEVTRFAVGDRVMGNFWTEWIEGSPPGTMLSAPRSLGGPLQGALAEYVAVPEAAAVATPANMTDVQASTLPVAALTAWFALTESGETGLGDIVLVQGTGGVALAGLKLATALGARVIVTSRSAEKLERASDLGAFATVVVGETMPWPERVLELTDGHGANHVLEIVGGANIEKSLDALAMGGRISVIGFLGGFEMRVSAVPLMLRRARLQGVSVGHRASFEKLVRFVEAKDLQPVIETVFEFEDVPAAFGRLGEGPFGKIVVRTSC